MPLALLALFAACSPGNPEVPDTGPADTWGWDCSSDDDGILDAGEFPWATGVSVPYRANAAGTAVAVAPDGTEVEGETTWDFTAAPGPLELDLDLVDPTELWCAGSFPGASWATPLSAHAPDLLAVFLAEPDRVALLGLASRDEAPAEGQTLVVYDEPIEVIRLPLALGTAWSASASFRDATILGVPNQGTEEYVFEADRAGTVLLPGYAIERALRLRAEVSQTFAVTTGENPLRSVRFLYLKECLGELARAVSLPGETNATFTEASELRVLDTTR